MSQKLEIDVTTKPANLSEDEIFRGKVRRTIIYYISIVLAVVAICYLYQAVMGAFLFSLLLVYLLQPAVNWAMSKGLKRGVANFSIVGGLFLLLGLVFASLLPILYRQTLVFSALLPQAFETLSTETRTHLRDFLQRFSINPSSLNVNQSHLSDTIKGYVAQYWSQGVEGIIGAGSLVFSSLLTLILIPVFTFFVMYHWPQIKAGIVSLTPPSLANRQMDFVTKVDRTMRAVIQGQLLVALSLAFLYMLGFSIIGIKASLLIGLICGICRLIPYLDILVALILCAVSVATHYVGWSQLVGVVVVIALVQSLDGALVTPKILGGRVGLHPIVVIATILSFGHLFGLTGILLAIPVAALVKVFIEQFLPAYLRFIRYIG